MSQLAIFSQPTDSPRAEMSRITNVQGINGLTYIPNFISQADEKSLLAIIDSKPWLSDLKRRVQHYGWKYDYKLRSIDYGSFLGPLPSWAQPLAKRLYQEQLISDVPDQLIINEYLPGQGIANHIDCQPCFGSTIISISLGSSAVMEFRHQSGNESIDVLLEPRSVVILANESRYNWTHGIPARKKDVHNGYSLPRQRRISLTFRNVIVGH